MSKGKLIRLTEAGRRIAESIFERHNYFKRIPLAAGVAEQSAKEEACALEHAISEVSFRKVLRRYQKSVQDS